MTQDEKQDAFMAQTEQSVEMMRKLFWFGLAAMASMTIGWWVRA